MHLTVFFALLASPSLGLTSNIDITVGADAELRFNPEVVKANVGDTLTFSYFPKNHSVVQSSFADPCHPLAGGFFSGFQPLAAGPGPVEFVVTVNDTKPIWIYCAQTAKSHCQSGMSMVVNEPPPPSPNTLNAYKAHAATTSTSSSPPRIAGGVFISTNATAMGSSSSTASSTVPGSSASSSGSSSSYSKGSSDSSSSGSSGSDSGSSSGSGSSNSNNGTLTFTGAASKMSARFAVFTLMGAWAFAYACL